MIENFIRIFIFVKWIYPCVIHIANVFNFKLQKYKLIHTQIVNENSH
jgi:hypothetical protein